MALQLGNFTNKNLVEKINTLESKVDSSGFLKKDEDATITGNFTFTNNVKLNGVPAEDNDAVTKKFVEDITTTLEDEYGSLVEKVEGLETELKPKVEKNIQDIATNKKSIDAINVKIGTLGDSVKVIGTIQKSSTEVEGQTTLLDNFVQEEVSREKSKGDLVVTNDNYNFYYNGTNWVKAGVRSVDFANTLVAGIVKLGSEEGQLEQVDAQGLVKVKGYTELKAQSDATKSNLEQNYYNKTEVDGKVQELQQADATATEKIGQLEEKIQEVKSSFKAVTDPSFAVSENKSKGEYQYVINNDGTKLIEVLGVFAENTSNGSIDKVPVDSIIKDNNTIIYSDNQSIKKIVYMELKLN